MSAVPNKYKRNLIAFPAALVYGLITGIRNVMFNIGLKREHSFDIPIIDIGNIAVGGTGKTPHTEYLINMLHEKYRIAVLSRGYRRLTSGYVLATEDSTAKTIGDEPYQIHDKYPDITVAVCESRVEGVNRLIKDCNPEIILLDDAFQHRYVKPSINVMLTDFNRFITYDMILPAGRLRESKKGMRRADIVIVTKCPEYVDTAQTSALLRKYTDAEIYFSSFTYGHLERFNGNGQMPLGKISNIDSVILVTGIANPEGLVKRLSEQTENIETVRFADHHSFSAKDISTIEQKYGAVKRHTKGNVYIVTTEKDSARLKTRHDLTAFSENLWIIPIEVSFMGNSGENFRSEIMNRLSV